MLSTPFVVSRKKPVYKGFSITHAILFHMSLRGCLFLCAGVVLCVLLLFFARSHIASGFVILGNRHFGGEGAYDLSRADLYYRMALISDRRTLHAYHQRARIAFLRGDFNEALSLIEKQITEHGPSFMSSYYIRGLIHGYRKEFAEAERDFKAFLTWDPHNWAALNDLAWVYFAQGKFEEAGAASLRGLAIAPQNPWLHMMYGMSRFNSGAESQALSHLYQARGFAKNLTDSDWVRAYPGNDPRIAGKGLQALRATIEDNIEHVNRSLAEI